MTMEQAAPKKQNAGKHLSILRSVNEWYGHGIKSPQHHQMDRSVCTHCHPIKRSSNYISSASVRSQVWETHMFIVVMLGTMAVRPSLQSWERLLQV